MIRLCFLILCCVVCIVMCMLLCVVLVVLVVLLLWRIQYILLLCTSVLFMMIICDVNNDNRNSTSGVLMIMSCCHIIISIMSILYS